MEEAETRCPPLRYEAELSRFDLIDKGEVKAELRRALEDEAESRGIIEAEERTREDMAKEALEGKTRSREKAEARIRVDTEALERAAKEAGRREIKEALRRPEEGERSEVQRLVTEQ